MEIAGRDSIAAAVLAAGTGSYDVLVPTIVYTGTEYGDWEVALKNAAALPLHLGGREVLVLDAVILGSPGWWHATAGRFAVELFDLYGFCPTCIACHMYLHASRVPLARSLGVGAVVSGERISHEGRLKLSQLEPCLRAYREILAGEGIELVMPLEDVADGRKIEELVGTSWEESGRQMRCVLEGNYRDPSGGLIDPGEGLIEYLDGFLAPVTRRILSAFRRGGAPPDYAGAARDTLRSATGRRDT